MVLDLDRRWVPMPDQYSPSHRLVRFGVFEVDLRAGEVRKAGRKINLHGQPIEILAMLLDHPGDVVTREELRQKLWPANTFVDFDHSLNKAINRLREALGDSADNPRFIETLPRRGYRFIVAVESPVQAAPSVVGALQAQEISPVRAVTSSAPRGSTSTVKARIVTLAVAVLLTFAVVFTFNVADLRNRLTGRSSTPQIQSLAVLPFENLSGDPGQDYFADGMTDELITNLAKIKELRVISRTSVMHYKGTTKTLPNIARELNVDAIVEASVVRSGDRVRVTAKLIHAMDEKHLWAETYERGMRDVLTLQGDLTGAIAEAIKVSLEPTEQARLAAARPVNPQALEAYLKGRYFWNKWTGDGVRKGIDYFQQAIEFDPKIALAYVGLADSYNSLGDFGIGEMPPNEAKAKAEAAALKAIDLDEMLGAAHAALAMSRFRYNRNWNDVDAEFKRAIELDPGDAIAHHWYAHYLMAAERINEALAESKRAYELSPVDPEMGVHLQWHYYYAHEYDRAIEQGRKTLELDPNFNEIHLYLGLALEQKGMYEEASAELHQAIDLSGGRVIALASLGHVYGVSGKRDAAIKILKELEGLSKRRYVSTYDLAMVHIGLGDRARAFAQLENSYKEGSYWMFTLAQDPRLDVLRSDPRLQDLVRRVGLPPPIRRGG